MSLSCIVAFTQFMRRLLFYLSYLSLASRDAHAMSVYLWCLLYGTGLMLGVYSPSQLSLLRLQTLLKAASQVEIPSFLSTISKQQSPSKTQLGWVLFFFSCFGSFTITSDCSVIAICPGVITKKIKCIMVLWSVWWA